MTHAISLITSLYRSESHLPAYVGRVQQMADALAAADIALQLVLVANEPTPAEHAHLTTLQGVQNAAVLLLQVPRESVYASWNRGFRAAAHDVLGPWNVDDERDPQATITAAKHLHNGAELIDMPHEVVTEQRTQQRPPYNPLKLSPKLCLSPFFLFTRPLYEHVGSFDDAFRVAGDLEWCWRPALRQASYITLLQSGGRMNLHGGNLSNGNNALEWVEINAILLKHGLYDQLRPVAPDLMRAFWSDWASANSEIPADVANWLWGTGAAQRYAAYERERRSHPLLRRMRLALARRGLWPSVEWDAHHQPKN
jgi:hypothetical protein